MLLLFTYVLNFIYPPFSSIIFPQLANGLLLPFQENNAKTPILHPPQV